MWAITVWNFMIGYTAAVLVYFKDLVILATLKNTIIQGYVCRTAKHEFG